MKLRHRIPAAVTLVLALSGCKSPEDIGERAGVIYIAPFGSVGADTVTMPCSERIELAKELFGKNEEKRAEAGIPPDFYWPLLEGT